MNASIGFAKELTPCGISGCASGLSDQRSAYFAAPLAKLDSGADTSNRQSTTLPITEAVFENGLAWSPVLGPTGKANRNHMKPFLTTPQLFCSRKRELPAIRILLW